MSAPAYEPIAKARVRKGLHYQRPRIVWTGDFPLLDALADLITSGDYTPKAPKRARTDRSRFHVGARR